MSNQSKLSNLKAEWSLAAQRPLSSSVFGLLTWREETGRRMGVETRGLTFVFQDDASTYFRNAESCSIQGKGSYAPRKLRTWQRRGKETCRVGLLNVQLTCPMVFLDLWLPAAQTAAPSPLLTWQERGGDERMFPCLESKYSVERIKDQRDLVEVASL